jgi:hypothetical protein
MRRLFLLFGLLLLTACTFVSEPIAVTRMQVATAVPSTSLPSPTPLPLSTATPAPPTWTATAVATITIIPIATPTQAPSLAPVSDEVQGWLMYENSFYNYRFSYPPTAAIIIEGVNGLPSEELPAGMTADAYLRQLEETLPNHICVGVAYQTGFVKFLPPWEVGGKYAAPCGGTGIGAYDIITVTQELTIEDQLYTAQGYAARERNEAATWRGEFYSLQLADGTDIKYGSFQGAQEQYLTIEGTLRQIVESFHVGTISGMTTVLFRKVTLKLPSPSVNPAR